MRPYSIPGLVLVVFGVIALAIRSITFFTTDTVVGPLGFFAWDVAKPHTIFINPIAGLIAIAIGVALMMAARRPAAG